MSMNRPYYLDPIFVSAPSRNEAASATHSYQPRTLSPDSGCQPRPPDKPCCTREGAELSLRTFCFKFWREYCEHRDETTWQIAIHLRELRAPDTAEALPEAASPNSLSARSDQKPVYLEHLMEFIVFR